MLRQSESSCLSVLSRGKLRGLPAEGGIGREVCEKWDISPLCLHRKRCLCGIRRREAFSILAPNNFWRHRCCSLSQAPPARHEAGVQAPASLSGFCLSSSVEPPLVPQPFPPQSFRTRWFSLTANSWVSPWSASFPRLAVNGWALSLGAHGRTVPELHGVVSAAWDASASSLPPKPYLWQPTDGDNGQILEKEIVRQKKELGGWRPEEAGPGNQRPFSFFLGGPCVSLLLLKGLRLLAGKWNATHSPSCRLLGYELDGYKPDAIFPELRARRQGLRGECWIHAFLVGGGTALALLDDRQHLAPTHWTPVAPLGPSCESSKLSPHIPSCLLWGQIP